MTTTIATSTDSEAPDTMTSNPHNIERFGAAYSAHYDDLWRYCLRRTRTTAEAEDVLSEVFTVAWRRLADVPDEPNTRPWLFGVARNHLRNTWRSAARSRDLHLQLVSDAAVAHTINATSAATADSTSDVVIKALDALSESDAELLRLVAWEQLSHRDLATMFECSENAIAIRIHRARQRLTTQLDTIRHTATNDANATLEGNQS